MRLSEGKPARARVRAATGRRARVVLLVLGLAGLWTIADALLLGPEPGGASGLARGLGVFALRVGGLFIAAGVFSAFRRFWHTRMRAAVVHVFRGLTGWSARLLPGWAPQRESDAKLRMGERIGLIAGLFIAALDVVLTALLLRDVFPEAPYRFTFLEALGSGVQDWAFYVAVAGLKTVLALWFGLYDRAREGASGQVLRWFVLGGASAFDAVLAIARGLVLAEQGITGAPVMVSNIVFVGFGIAVPWVVAHTGRLLAAAVDPLLARMSLLRVLAAIPILLFLGAIWAAVLVIVVPTGALLLALGILTAVWFAMEDTAAMILGQEASTPPADPALVRAGEEPPRDPEAGQPPMMARHSLGGAQ